VRIIVISFILGALTLFGNLVFAQDPTTAHQKDTPDPATSSADSSHSSTAASNLRSKSEKKIDDLNNILLAINELETSIEASAKNLKEASSQGFSQEIEDRLKNQNDKLKRLRDNLDEIASGIHLTSYEVDSEAKQVEWGQELHDLLSPLLNEIKKYTNRPRELDRLGRRIETLKGHVEESKIAVENIKNLAFISTSPELNAELKELSETWDERRVGLVAEISVAEQRLNQLISEATPIGESLKKIPDLFFKSRGRNLVLAIFSTVFFWWSVRSLYHLLRKSNLMTSQRFSEYRRLVNLFYLFFSGSGCLLIFLLALFLLGDWVLLIISLLIVFGIVWSSKQALPHFWNQGALLLNIGPVREGEMVIYNGVPWEVVAMNLYVNLRNPELEPGIIRVPIGDLFQLRSRQMGKGEQWFPSRKSEWVLLSDSTFGKVVSQTPSKVSLLLLGGSIKSYSVEQFLEQSPQNLSTGFRVSSVFGLDYKHQSEITDKIPEMLRADLKTVLDAKLGEKFYKVSVELSSASASSLDLQINLDVDGKFAAEYMHLARLLQKISVDSSNTHNWSIPFTQMTLHVANEKIRIESE